MERCCLHAEVVWDSVICPFHQGEASVPTETAAKRANDAMLEGHNAANAAFRRRARQELDLKEEDLGT